MFRFKLRSALVALTAIAALGLPASTLATNVTEWNVGQLTKPYPGYYTTAAPYASVPTGLQNPYREYNERLPTGYYVGAPSWLVYGHETFGVALTWGTPSYGSSTLSDIEWEFIRRPGHYVIQQIPASEHVALYNTVNHEYLVRGCTADGCINIPPAPLFGIDLAWSTTPSYEWQVAKGGDLGHPDLADVYNDIEKAYLIEHHRTFGVDLGWIHAPFYTGRGYVPPASPLPTTTQRPVSAPLPVK